MAQKTAQPNTERVLRCVAEALKTISFSHPSLDFYFDGIIVDQGKDVTAALQDRQADYDIKGVILIVQPGDVSEAQDERTAQARRQTYQYPIWCMATLTGDDLRDGINLAQKQERIVADVRQLLSSSAWIKQAAETLGYATTFNGQRVSCINHKVINVVSDNGNAYPSINFDIICEFKYDEYVPLP